MFKNYSVVPIVDSNKIMIKIITSEISSLKSKKGLKIFSQEIPVVIMAGGVKEKGYCLTPQFFQNL